jgi:predicted PurR-regulated permease PerM
LSSNAQQYQATVEHKIDLVGAATLGRLAGVMQRVDRQMQPAKQPAPNPAGGTQAGNPKPVPVEVQQAAQSPFNLARRILQPVISPAATVMIVFVVAIFILLQREDLRDRMIRLFGSGDLHRTTTAMNDAGARLGRYFLTQLCINAGSGVVIMAGLMLIGVPSAPLWGIVATLLRFVPYIGAWLAAVPPLALAAAVEPGWSMFIGTAALYFATEFIIGQAVEPMLYRHSTGLSPFAVVVAATFWTWLWGPIGLILSTPLTLCLVVLGRHVDRLEFLDVLLGDRPALTPVESFYQRMLAGDPDEAADQAEVLLHDRSLSTYYDEVAIKGLQLAANDAMRGVLTELHLELVKSAARDLIADLDTHHDRDPNPDIPDKAPAAPSRAEQAVPRTPAPGANATLSAERPLAWKNEAPVLCLAGRGPIDDAAAMILAQLLAKHGLGARVAGYSSAARDSIATLDMTGVAMVCISYLEISGTPSHLRYLLRRLRLRAPGVRVLIGLWPPTDEVLRDDRLRATIGADDYASTLREAVEACLAASRWSEPAAPPLLSAA